MSPFTRKLAYDESHGENMARLLPLKQHMKQHIDNPFPSSISATKDTSCHAPQMPREHHVLFNVRNSVSDVKACQFYFLNTRDDRNHHIHIHHDAWKDMEKSASHTWYCGYHTTGIKVGNPKTAIKKQQRIFIVKEKGYYHEFMKEKSRPKAIQTIKRNCGIVISPYKIPGYEGRWIRLPCLLWRYGVYISDPEHGPQPTSRAIWERILSSKRQQKTRMLSVFCSARLNSEQYKQRHRFVKALKDAMGDDVHVYGRGYRGKKTTYPFLANKADGLDPYRYTIALENNTIPHFWTEKIPDAYLGEAYPFYYGGSNLGDYFPTQAFTPIDIFDIEGSIKTIKDICHSPLWEERYPYILEAKRRVIEEYHLKNILRRIIEGDESLYEKTGV